MNDDEILKEWDRLANKHDYDLMKATSKAAIRLYRLAETKSIKAKLLCRCGKPLSSARYINADGVIVIEADTIHECGIGIHPNTEDKIRADERRKLGSQNTSNYALGVKDGYAKGRADEKKLADVQVRIAYKEGQIDLIEKLTSEKLFVMIVREK